LRYGLRRFGRLGGILVVVAIMTFFGIIACLIPGLYVIVATSLVIPCALFERGSSAIAGSFRLVNRNFGGVLGRVLLTWLLASVPSVVAYCFGGFSAAGNAGLAVDALADSSPSAADSIGSTVFSQILSVPTTMFVIAATLATYAQMRSREAWTSVADLNTALDRTDATRW
jgi:TctA family transporter